VGEEGIEPPSFSAEKVAFPALRCNIVSTPVGAVDRVCKRNNSLTADAADLRELDVLDDAEIAAFRAAWEGLEPSLHDALEKAAREPSLIQAALARVLDAAIEAAHARLD